MVTVAQLGVLVVFSALGGVGALVLLAVGTSYGARRAVSASIRKILDKRAALKLPPHEGQPLTEVVTDVEGSTRLWDLYPDAMNEDLAKHDKLVRDAIYLFYGYEVLTEGDAFKVAFHTPEQAIQFCVYVQESLVDVQWSSSIAQDRAAGNQSPLFCGLRIRMGVHSSVAAGVRRHENTHRIHYTGSAETVAKALCDAANGGQILISGQTLADVGTIEFIAAGGDSNMTSRVSGGIQPRFQWENKARRRLRRSLMRKNAAKERDLSFHIVHRGAHFLDVVSNASVTAGAEDKDIQRTAGSEESDPVRASSSISSGKVQHHKGDRAARISSHALENAVQAGQEESRSAETDAMKAQRRWRRLLESGKHEIIEVVPNALSHREFGRLNTVRQVTPSYEEAPEQSVTFGFTYIEGAKALREWNEGLFRDALHLHNRAIRAALAEFNGYEVREMDGQFLVAFHSEKEAVQCALACQKALLRLNWDSQLMQHSAACRKVAEGTVAFRGLRVQIGLCTGGITERRPCRRTGRAEYFGSVLNKTARIAATAHGGQVLANQSTIGGLSKECVKALRLHLRRLGLHRLKGMQRPEYLFEVTDVSLSVRRFSEGLKVKQSEEMSDIFLSFVSSPLKFKESKKPQREGITSTLPQNQRNANVSSSFSTAAPAYEMQVTDDFRRSGISLNQTTNSDSISLNEVQLDSEQLQPGYAMDDGQDEVHSNVSHQSCESEMGEDDENFHKWRMSVLVCDDSAVQQAVLQQSLNQLGFHDVVTFTSATSALEELFSGKKQFRLVCLDVHTNGEIDGLTACRLIRQRLSISAQPTILIISGDPSIHIERAYADGADGFLQKPISKSSLEAVLARETERLQLFADQASRTEELDPTNNITGKKEFLRNSRDSAGRRTAMRQELLDNLSFVVVVKPTISSLGSRLKTRLKRAGYSVYVVQLDASLSSSLAHVAPFASVVMFDGFSWDLEQEPDGFWASCASAVLKAISGPCVLSLTAPAEVQHSASFSLALMDVGFERVHQLPKSAASESNGYDPAVEALFKLLERDAALAQLNLQLDAFVEACEVSNELIQISSAQSGGIQYVNPAFTIATGYSRNEVLGQATEAMRSDQNPPDLLEEMTEGLLGPKSMWSGSYNGVRKGGYILAKQGTISSRSGGFHVEVMHDLAASRALPTASSASSSAQCSQVQSFDL